MALPTAAITTTITARPINSLEARVQKIILVGAALLTILLMPWTANADEAPLKSAPDGRPLALTFADEFHDFRRTLPNNLPSADTDSARKEVGWRFRPSQR